MRQSRGDVTRTTSPHLTHWKRRSSSPPSSHSRATMPSRRFAYRLQATEQYFCITRRASYFLPQTIHIFSVIADTMVLLSGNPFLRVPRIGISPPGAFWEELTQREMFMNPPLALCRSAPVPILAPGIPYIVFSPPFVRVTLYHFLLHFGGDFELFLVSFLLGAIYYLSINFSSYPLLAQ